MIYMTIRTTCLRRRLPIAFECRVLSATKTAGRRFLTTETDVAPNFAFAFDIDGVLLRGAKPLAEGKMALKLLQDHKIPWVLLTNGGGKSEVARVADLSEKLDIEISTKQFIQSHTPFRRLVDNYSKVLVVGGDVDTCRHVAEDYGFKDCAMSLDIVATQRALWPFHRFTPEELKHARTLSDDAFNAILMFNDSRDWGCDTQVIIDLLTSEGGKLGTKNNSLEQTLPIYFSNNDLLWANEYHLPRFGQGAFRTSIEKVFKDYTGRDMQSTIIGKPYLFTYEYAHGVLNEWRQEMYGYDGKLRRVYMIGDNPASDIRGGNGYGWYTILVRTGVFKDGDELDAAAKPKVIVDNVLEAVMHAIQNEIKLK
ncbi:HAD-like domain-containing protein [Lipomyces orientalis]|uniref:HAD-like domain-containing protein n=1 Tax=Lipomyces orientalis TaxID=1233043 RepID=A0ACC3TQJ6_9ASCO